MIATHALTLGLGALLATTIAMLALLRLAPILGLMDHPDPRKRHDRPTPAVGGLAIALGCAAGASALGGLGRAEAALALGGLIMLISGGLDDRFDLTWPWKLAAQAAAASVLISVGRVEVNSIDTALGFNGRDLGFLAAPFTILATIGLINAINMMDGLDGLAGAVVLAALGMLSGAALYAGNAALAKVLILLSGGVAAFLLFNLRLPGRPRARAFLGNAGSELLGLAIAWGCFRVTQTPSHPVTPVLAPFLIAAPVIDCLALLLRRLAAGRSPFSADRNHLHHALGDAGLSPTLIVVVITAANLALGLGAALALLRHTPQPLFIVAFLGLTALYAAARWPRAKKRAPLLEGTTAVEALGASDRLGA